MNEQFYLNITFSSIHYKNGYYFCNAESYKNVEIIALMLITPAIGMLIHDVLPSFQINFFEVIVRKCEFPKS